MLEGLKTTLLSMLRKPVTVQYPEAKATYAHPV
jgi:formate hydrogenlyase subunit 6/NADH:ubiquinone oxidoreductase subunit I